MTEDYPVALKWARLDSLRQHACSQGKSLDIYFRDVRESVLPPDYIAEHRPDIVFHLAGLAGIRDWQSHPQDYIDANISTTISVLNMCREFNCRYVFASSVSTYGDGGVLLSLYSITKLASEMIGRLYDRSPVTNLRFDTVYGPWGRPDMAMLQFIHHIHNSIPITIFGDGEQTRAFIYVDDIVNGCINSIDNAGYNELYLGYSSQVSINNLVRMIESIVGSAAIIQYTDRDSADMLHSPDILKSNLSTVDITTGITNTYRWYLSNLDLVNNLYKEHP